ncbi:MAG: glycosyltransferase family 4 protein [Chloroflexi bacterium]|nr:glycosyltransferase family 4 protein [Chloroflexota bacterium]
MEGYSDRDRGVRIVLITGEYPPQRGGIADYTQYLGEGLRERGLEIWVLTSTAAAEQAETPSLGIIPVITKWNFASWRKIKGVLQNTGAQIAHIQYQTAAYGMHPAIHLLPFWLRRRWPQGRIITTLHDLRPPYLFPKAGRLRRWAIWAMIKGSHAVVVTNDEDEQNLRRTKTGSHCYLIPIGSNIQPVLAPSFQREAWRAQYGIFASDTLLSYFGLLNAGKGLDTLLESLSRLRQQEPGLKLLMIGEEVGASDPTNIAYRRHLLELADRLELKENLLWTGYLPPNQVSAHLMASDICVLPYKDGASFRRGSLIAALVHGLPIVTTQPHSFGKDTSLPPLTHGQNCLLVPPEDATALTEAVNLLRQSPQLRHQLAEAARTTGQRFSWAAIAEETEELYRQVLAL